MQTTILDITEMFETTLRIFIRKRILVFPGDQRGMNEH